MVRIITLIALGFLSSGLSGQISIMSANVASFSTASEGDFYLDENGVYYLGLQDGSLKIVGNVAAEATEDGALLRWDQASGSWIAEAAPVGGLTLTKSTIRTVDRARIAMSPASNINLTTHTIQLGAFEQNETNATISGSTISGLSGKVRFVVQPNIQVTTVIRPNFTCQFYVNGNLTKQQFGSLYARNDSGHNQTGTTYIFEIENVMASDQFEFRLQPEAGTGSTVALVSSGTTISHVYVEQYNEIEVVTNVTAPVDLSIVQGPQGLQGPVGPAGPQGPPGANAPLDVYHASGNIASSGSPNVIVGATVSRTNVGRYTVTFTDPHSNGAAYPVLFSMSQNPGADDYVPAYSNVTANGFDVQITEQDNSTAAGVFRDAGFSFYIPL